MSGVGCREVLRASHIKPFSKCEKSEHYDKNNGLLLRADLDALFDCGFISFSDNGEMIVSPEISSEERLAFNLQLGKKLRPTKAQETPNKAQKEYLKWHRENIFKK